MWHTQQHAQQSVHYNYTYTMIKKKSVPPCCFQSVLSHFVLMLTVNKKKNLERILLTVNTYCKHQYTVPCTCHIYSEFKLGLVLYITVTETRAFCIRTSIVEQLTKFERRHYQFIGQLKSIRTCTHHCFVVRTTNQSV